MKELAVVTGVGFGLRDFPDKEPGLWFGLGYLSGSCLMTFQRGDVKWVIKESGCYDIKELKGRICVIENEGPGSHVEFVRWFNPKD